MSYLLENGGAGQRWTKGGHIFPRSDRDLRETESWCGPGGKGRALPLRGPHSSQQSYSLSPSSPSQNTNKILLWAPPVQAPSLFLEVGLDGAGPAAASHLRSWRPEAR